MNNKYQNVLRHTWCDVQRAIREVQAMNNHSSHKLEKCCKRLVYSKDRNMAAIELDNRLFESLFGEPLRTSEIKKALIGHADYDWIDAMDLDQLVYFYFGLHPDDESELMQVADLACLV